jgi:hypothetical protein
MKVVLRYPDYSEEGVDYLDSKMTVAAALDKIVDRNRTLMRDRVKLVCGGTQLLPGNTLQEHGLREGSTIEILLRLGAPVIDPTDVTYDPFIIDTLPRNGDANIPLSIQPLIMFKKNRNGLSLFLPSLENIQNYGVASTGDMRSYLGEELSAGMGFTKWTEAEHSARALLLEVAPAIMVKIEQVKYSWRSRGQLYAGGDVHSWQRYTRSQPVDAYVHVDEGAQTIRILPTSSLKPGTTYAVLLMNGVPTVQSDEAAEPWFSFTRPGMLEDKLICFKTKEEEGASSVSLDEGSAISFDRNLSANVSVS